MKLFRTPIKYTEYVTGKKREILDISGVTDLIKENGKPVVVEG